jgi:hypothetical protein
MNENFLILLKEKSGDDSDADLGPALLPVPLPCPLAALSGVIPVDVFHFLILRAR